MPAPAFSTCLTVSLPTFVSKVSAGTHLSTPDLDLVLSGTWRSRLEESIEKITIFQALPGTTRAYAEALGAEREGFEPPIRLPVCRISSAVHSTTLPPLQLFDIDALLLSHLADR
jgi:hypothetical protein